MSGSSPFPQRPALAAAFRRPEGAAPAGRFAPARSSQASAVWVSPREIVDGARLCGIDRIFLLSPLHDEGEGALDLAEAACVDGRRSVAICLSPVAGAASVAGLPSTAKGLGDLVAGRAGISETLHGGRSRLSHVIPSAGFDPSEAGPEARGRVAFALDALRLTYATTVVAYPVGALDLLRDYADSDSAIVLALPEGGEKLARWVRLELGRQGFTDVLFMRREARLPWA